MSVEQAKSRVEEAKSALKTAKEELEAAKKGLDTAKADEKKSKKRKLDSDNAASAKKQKVDIEALKKAVKKARKAFKADKNATTKAALKKAKAAVEAAEEAAKKAEEEEEEESEEESEEEEEKEEEEEEEEEKEEEKKDEVVKTNGSASAGVDNPTGCAKVFCGNLSWSIEDNTIREFFKDCGEIAEIFWLEDKESGKFKGCGFITFSSPEGASKAVALSGQDLMGRDIKVEFSLPREKSGFKKKDGSSKFGGKPLSERPDNCTTVFAGNLSFDVDDDQMHTFAEDCGNIKQIRWLTDRETGDFKGCGFIEFYDAETVDKFIKKNGTELMGRPIRLDYSVPKSR